MMQTRLIADQQNTLVKKLDTEMYAGPTMSG